MKLSITLAALAFLTTSAPAAIIITAPTGTTEGSIQITTDITFTLTSPVMFGTVYLILDELAPSDSSATAATFNEPPTVGTSPVPMSPGAVVATFYDNWADSTGAPTANDGVIRFDNLSPIPLFPDSTFTLSAGTYTLAATSDFNPLTSGTFDGPMFLVGNMSGLSISNIVPEPSTAMFSIGALAMTFFRRRR